MTRSLTRPIDWSDLKVFLAIARARSVSRGATELGITHATALRRLAALEQALEQPLFDRGGGRYTLSGAGADLLSDLEGMADRLAEAPARVGANDDEVRGQIRLTTTDTLVHGLLMPLIHSFCEAHPDVRLQVIVNNNFLSLTRREADIAIRGSNRPPENLVGRRVGNIQTAPYASRAYLKSVGRRRALEQLEWIAPDESLAHLEQSKWLARHVPATQVVMRVDSLVGMVHAAAHGMGAAMLLCPLADERPDLVRIAEPQAALDTQLWILTHPDLRQVARVRAFSQYMFETLSSDGRLVH
jgi:DNA-binding transcriptional LysR family regulator